MTDKGQYSPNSPSRIYQEYEKENLANVNGDPIKDLTEEFGNLQIVTKKSVAGELMSFKSYWNNKAQITRLKLNGFNRVLWLVGDLPVQFQTIGTKLLVEYEIIFVKSYTQSWVLSLRIFEDKKNI